MQIPMLSSYRLRREWSAAQAHAEALLALATEQGFALWVAAGTMQRGAALAAQGQGDTGIAEIHQGLAAHRATGAQQNLTAWLAVLATAYGDVGQPEAGLPLLDEALAVGDKNDERFHELTFRTPRMVMHVFSRGIFRTDSTPQPWYVVVA